MAVELILAPEAEQDIAETYIWYEGRRPGLGRNSSVRLMPVLKTSGDGLRCTRLLHETYRRALTRRFPYAVFHEVSGSTLTVYGVFHNARDPGKWRQRLS
jgi:hypothetical protein